MNEKLQEIFNKAYWEFYYLDGEPSLEKIPHKFTYLLEKHGCLIDHMPFEKKPNDTVILKHPYDVWYGLCCYGNLLIPHEFAVKVVVLGHLPI